MGYTLSAFARGLDQTPVAKQDAHSAIKSVGNSATTPRDLTTDEDVWLMLVLLSESVAMRMDGGLWRPSWQKKNPRSNNAARIYALVFTSSATQ